MSSPTSTSDTLQQLACIHQGSLKGGTQRTEYRTCNLANLLVSSTAQDVATSFPIAPDLFLTSSCACTAAPDTEQASDSPFQPAFTLLALFTILHYTTAQETG
jgi:hypothetical protein